MRTALSLALAAGLASAERVWLKSMTKFPAAKTLEIVHFFTALEQLSPEVSIAGPVTLEPKGAEISGAINIALIPTKTLDKLAESGTFCENNKFKFEGVHSFNVDSGSLSGGFLDQYYKITTSDTYYVALVNCGDKAYEAENKKGKTVGVKFGSGELVFVTRDGYLPGEDRMKLKFYLGLLFVYLGALAGWIMYCSTRSDAVFRIHHYISVGLVVGAIEAACWYASYYHWNFIGHRWWSMIVVAGVGTATKQGVCLGVLLLACLGVGVTKARLDPKTTVKIFVIVALSIGFESARQTVELMQPKVGEPWPIYMVIALILPGTLMQSVLVAWCHSALTDITAELEEGKQEIKLEVYRKLQRVLFCFVIVIFGCFGWDSYVSHTKGKGTMSIEWENRWLLSDALSHSLVFILCASLMWLWRPSERSLQMMWSEQLSGDGNVEMTSQGQKLGEKEKDFQSVDVELGDDPQDEFSFQKSVQDAKSKKPVLE